MQRTEHVSTSPHTLEPRPWRNQRQWAATLAVIGVVGLIIAALYLIQTATTTITARELLEMDAHRQQLERDNDQLHAEIADLRSLPRVMTRAAELGFREAREDEIQYIIVEGYRYDRARITPTPTANPTSPAAVYDETLSGWLRQQWDSLKRQWEQWRNG